MEAKTLIKKFLTCFGLAFLVTFVIFFTCLILVQEARDFTEDKVPVFEFCITLMYLMPSGLVMSILFGTCIGLVQFFISINIVNNSSNKKLLLLTLFLALLLSVVNFLLSELPGGINSAKLIKTINTLSEAKPAGYEHSLNTYKMELHKRYSLPAGTFIFAFYALTLALLLQHRKIAGLIISILSCLLYWALLAGGTALAIKLGKNGVLNTWFPTLLFAYLTINFYLVHELFKLHKKNIADKDKGAENITDYNI